MSILLSGSDPEGAVLVFKVATNPSNGGLFGTPPNLTYTPNANYHGSDAFEFGVSDGELESSHATVTLTIEPVNDPPTIGGTPLAVTLTDVSYSFAPTGTDVDGDSLTFSVANPPPWATFDTATGSLSGVPEEGDIPTLGSRTYAGIEISVSDGDRPPVSMTFDLRVDDGSAPTQDGEITVLSYNHELKLEWTNSSAADLTSLLLLRRDDGTFPTDPMDPMAIGIDLSGASITPGETVSIRDDGLVNGNQCQYVLFAFDEANNYTALESAGTPQYWASFAAGYEHVLLLAEDGTVWAWGMNCEAGWICQAGDCYQLCTTQRDCPGGKLCVGDTCQDPKDGALPSIDSIIGNDGADTTRVIDGIVVTGRQLGSATFEFQTIDSAVPLTVRDQTSDSAELVFPPEVLSGDYTLVATNSAGSTQEPVILTLPDLTGTMIVDRINEVATTGTISVDRLDPTQVQVRIDDTCETGSSVSAIAQDGSVTCESPTHAVSSGVIPYADGIRLADTAIHYDGTGHVGIGTRNPSAALQVSGTPFTYDNAGATTTNTSPRCDCDIDSEAADCTDPFTTDLFVGNDCYDWFSTTAGSGAEGENHFVTLDRPTFVVTDNGRVGIGTGTPSHALSVDGEIFLNNRRLEGANLLPGSYDGADKPSVLPGFQDAFYYAESRGFTVTVTDGAGNPRPPDYGSKAQMFNLNRNSFAHWVDVNTTPVSIEIALPSPLYIDTLTFAFGWRNSHAIDYVLEFEACSGNPCANPTWFTAATVTGNRDYSLVHRISRWNVTKVRFSVTAAGNSDMANVLRLASIQGLSPVHGKATGHMLDVGGDTLYGHLLAGADGAIDLGGDSNHFRNIYATNDVIQTSDARMKTEIEDLPYGLVEILKLQPRRYRWKTHQDSGRHLGLIAQEVRGVLPEAVHIGADEDASLGLRYGELTPVLIKAIQEQQTIIDELRAEVRGLCPQDP